MSEQDQEFTVSSLPIAAARPTAFSLAYDAAVFLNGDKLDQVAAGCVGVDDGRIGCRDMASPDRDDPLAHGRPMAQMNTLPMPNRMGPTTPRATR